MLLTIGDPWMYEGVPAMAERASAVWMAYYPVDGYPLPTSWKRWAQAVDVPVVFSKFARDVVQNAIGKAPELIYHGVNTKTFSPGDRQKAKELAKVSGHFVVGTVARNQMRKNIPALVKAFAKFAKGKDDALLYLHTQLKGEFDIAELVKSYGIAEKTRITGEIAKDKGVPDELVATIYRAMDVFVLPTMAEGFGLPIMESQACGTPALVTDFSACPELVPDAIQRLKVKETLTMTRNFEQAIVDVDDIVEKLELLYGDRDRLKKLGERCHQFAQSFEWTIAYKQFNDLIASPRFQALAAKRRQLGGVSKVAKSAGPFSQRQIDPAGKKQNGVAIAESQPSRKLEPFEEVDQLHSEAVAKMQAGKVAEVVPLLRRVVELRPRNPEFQNQLAVALQSDGKLDEAIIAYKRSIELRPGRHQVWTNLANACLANGDIVGATSSCEKALKLAPDSAPAHDLHGVILRRQGDVQGAKRQFEKALALMPEHKPAQIHLAETAGGSNVAVDEQPDPSSAGLNEANALQMLNAAAAGLVPYPGGFEGRGIVIVGGGTRYFPCAWVCIRMLRECGCTLPIELWHLGPQEMSEQMRELVRKYDVECIDGRARAADQQMGALGGWEIKSFAIMHSRFREVLLLDADNFPLVNPESLFESAEYAEYGAIFWPDLAKLKPYDKIWELTGVPYQNEPSFESGQILVDKSRAWEPLSLALWLNQNSSFWYRHILGDKDTFHLAWRKLGRPYAMPSKEATMLSHAAAQHDFEGNRVFQHRSRAKWVLSGWNPRIEGFEREDRGFAYLEELKSVWNPEARPYNMAATERLQRAWKQYESSPEYSGGMLSIAIEDSAAWRSIGKVAKHLARCIADAHAVSLLEQAIIAAPKLGELHAILGTTLGQMGRHDEARASFVRAERIASDLPGLKENMALDDWKEQPAI